MTAALDRHKTKVGKHRKQVVKAVEQARDMAPKCRNDADMAAVLRWLLNVTTTTEKVA